MSIRPYRIAGRLVALLSSLVILATACTYSHGDEVVPCDIPATGVTYAATVAPIIQLNCRAACHNAAVRRGGVNFDDFNDVQFYALNGEMVRRIELDPGHPDFMPKGGGKLPACDIARIKAWAAAGALNN